MEAIMPIKYKENIVIAAYCLKKALANIVKMTNLALHDMKGAIIMLIIRSCLDSNILEDIIDGTLQPNPIINGTNALPSSPIVCINLSIMNAARDM